jgi:hypothetical protein
MCEFNVYVLLFVRESAPPLFDVAAAPHTLHTPYAYSALGLARRA